MAQVSKITFSSEELDAITHPDFFYIKHAAMQKVMELLNETQRSLSEIVLSHQHISGHTNIESPKIFRGENYRHLPYMVLDYPRKFSAETVFAFRTMFWWGKEFSFTLHLQGEALNHYRKIISEKVSTMKGNDFYFCINKTPWQYYFENDNYLPLDELLDDDQFKEQLQTNEFFKLSRKLPVKDFKRVPEYAEKTFSLLLKVIK